MKYLFITAFFLLSVNNALAQDCTAPNGDHGVIVFNQDFGIWQGCTPQGWIGLNAMVCPEGDGNSDPCSFEGVCSTPSPGTVCADGSIFAGPAPDDGAPMFTTAEDGPPSRWDNAGCYDCGTGPANTGIDSDDDGRINVAAMRAWVEGNTSSGDLNGFDAARYCDELSVHDKSDWYLPARNELLVLYDSWEDIGGFNTTSWPQRMYKSSSEHSTGDADTLVFPDGTWTAGGHRYKHVGRSVRCVRR
ncbi:MAG: hypothetical protein RLQ73_00145 [Hoeflea sp. D1-CHI-28]